MEKKRPESKKTRKFFWLTILCIIIAVCWGIYGVSLGRQYQIEGQKQFISINQGETYTGLIDRLAQQNKIEFPTVVKIYRKLMVHGTLKAGV